MRKLIALVGFTMLLASPAFGQAADSGDSTTLSAQAAAGGYACSVQSCGVYGSGNIIFPNNPSAAALAGNYSTFFLPAPGGAAGAFAYQPKRAPSGAAAFAYEPSTPSTAQECGQRFKSYDPLSGTYLGRDGYRRSCP